MLGRELANPIKIGNDVWIGICPRIKIGASSVAIKDLPTNVVAARKSLPDYSTSALSFSKGAL